MFIVEALLLSLAPEERHLYALDATPPELGSNVHRTSINIALLRSGEIYIDTKGVKP